MKKVLAFCLSLMLVMSMSLVAFAASNNFVGSAPSILAPVIKEFNPADEDCAAEIIITPYANRDELPETLRVLIEKAYNDIITAEELAALNDAFAKYVADLGISSENLAVSDLFDIRVTGCDFHEGHVGFDIVLSAETLKNFVGLLHMNKDGEWEFVSNAKVLEGGDHLSFSVESFTPFAIVVDTSGGQTGDNSMIPVYAIIMTVSALALAVIIVKSKKQKAVD